MPTFPSWAPPASGDAIPKLGLITITPVSPAGSAIQLDTDPETYTTEWPRRQSIHEGIDGAVTKQDFGRIPKDMVIKLESGPNQWLNKSTVKAIEALSLVKRQLVKLEDGEGNVYNPCTIEEFNPNQAKGMAGLYTYTLVLHVFDASPTRLGG